MICLPWVRPHIDLLSVKLNTWLLVVFSPFLVWSVGAACWRAFSTHMLQVILIPIASFKWGKEPVARIHFGNSNETNQTGLTQVALCVGLLSDIRIVGIAWMILANMKNSLSTNMSTLLTITSLRTIAIFQHNRFFSKNSSYLSYTYNSFCIYIHPVTLFLVFVCISVVYLFMYFSS